MILSERELQELALATTILSRLGSKFTWSKKMYRQMTNEEIAAHTIKLAATSAKRAYRELMG